MTRSRSRLFQGTFIYVFLILVIAALSLPPLWMILMSIKAPEIAFTIPPVWFFVPTLENYVNVVTRPFFFQYLMNSLVISVVVAVLQLLLGAPAAYSLSRYHTGGKFMLFLVLGFRTFPFVLLGVPFFVIFTRLGLMDNIIRLIIANTIVGLPFTIWLLMAFFDDIPTELEEAARIDGCSRYGAMWRVVFPLAQSGMVVVAILNFMGTWNNFFFPLIIATQNAKTMTLVASEFITDWQVMWGNMAAVGTLLMIPPILVVFFLQRRLVRGLTLGGVK
jgi:multiple sugar transport system permease protein